MTARERLAAKLRECPRYKVGEDLCLECVISAVLTHAEAMREEAAGIIQKWVDLLVEKDKADGRWDPRWEGQPIDALRTAVGMILDIKVE